jgi:predicted dehydrogenase
MDKVRVGVIGAGNMGSSHIRQLAGCEVPGAELSAVCDIKQDRLELVKEGFGDAIRLFDNAGALFEAEVIDAVIIATPHYEHPVLAMKAFEKNLHVLSEKPAGVYTKNVREMNQAALKSGKVFGIMYNQRTNPLYQKVRELVLAGELGEIKRVNWIITTWYRSQSYFNSGGWRATWAGEGGGVLLNQCPHQIDLLQWICGMPKRVRSFMAFGKYHDIEVEDDVTTYMEYENGATGVFITGTADTPGTNRFEILGNKGKAVIEDGQLKYWRLPVPERQFNREFTGGFGEPENWRCEIPIHGTETAHSGIMANWTAAIRNGSSLLAPGIEGINGLSLTNAMYLSAWTDNWVELPLDEDLYYEKLQERIKASKFVKPEANEKTLDVEGTH